MPHDPDDLFLAEAWVRMRDFVRHRYPGFTREQIEDVVQDAIALYIQYCRRHRLSNSIALLCKIVAARAASHWQKLKRESKRNGRIQSEMDCDPPGPDPGQDELFRRVRAYIERERPDDLQLVALVHVGLTHAEIAEAVGMNREAVSQRISRLYKQIRRQFLGPRQDEGKGGTLPPDRSDP